MGLSPTAAGLISAGSSLLGSAINAGSTARQNKLQRQWNEKMYGIQRQDSLSDWNMQNEYNSPTSQMARLKAAGLNPHLVYGNGADTTASPVRSTESKSWNPQTPQVDLANAASSGIMAYQDARIRDAQLNNLKANNTILLEDAMNKVVARNKMIAETTRTMSDTDRIKFDLETQNSLRPYQIEAARLSNVKTAADTNYTIDKNEREAIMQASNLTQAFANLLKTKAETQQIRANTQQIQQLTKNAAIDGKLKDLELGLAQKGIYKNDPAYARVLTRLVNSISETTSAGFNPNALSDAIDEYLKTLKKP